MSPAAEMSANAATAPEPAAAQPSPTYPTTFEDKTTRAHDTQLALHYSSEVPFPSPVVTDRDSGGFDVWAKTVKVEENLYYWRRPPVYTPGANLDTPALTAVELFCGCGGTSMGFEMAGFEILLGIDIHIPSVETFRLNHPKAGSVLGDIKTVDAERVRQLLNGRRPDVLIGGIPCQGFSLNNRKRHANDERNFLYREFMKFVQVLRPRAVVLENVSGMRSAANGDFVRDIERDISEASGLPITSKMLYAPDYGVPQKRQRILFVGVPGGKPFDFALVEKTHGPNTGREYVTVRDALSDLPSLAVNATSTEYATPPQTDFQRSMRVASKPLTNHKAPNHPADTVAMIARTEPGKPMYAKFKQRIRLHWEGLSPTQVSGGIRPQFQFGHPADARGLSIRERCRLQSFPDHFEVKGGTVQGRVQTGNAVPPLLAKAVACAIEKYL